jgi:hypothetical protein
MSVGRRNLTFIKMFGLKQNRIIKNRLFENTNLTSLKEDFVNEMKHISNLKPSVNS